MGRTYFFCGIGGSGMSALARLLLRGGDRVYGSDRAYDAGQAPEKFARLVAEGVRLFPQDGTGVTTDVDILVVSSAIEETVPDIRAARACGVSIQKRAALLAELFNGARGLAIGGTSGKTTVTGMTAWILCAAGLDPSVMNGGEILDFPAPDQADNARRGAGDWFVAEMDESDGSIALYRPALAVLNNITLDHKPLGELRALFRDFLVRAEQGAVLNLDDPEAAALAVLRPDALTFGIDAPAARLRADRIVPAVDGAMLDVHDTASGETVPLRLGVPGRHNVLNALAALGAARMTGVPLDQAVMALEGFHGIRRRFEVVGTAGGIGVIDDFAHNPDKIAATLRTLRETEGRILAVFQPHGFSPTKLLKDGLVQAFAEGLGSEDILFLPEIYYAGGRVEKSISSADLAQAVTAAGRQARFYPRRADIPAVLAATARSGDRIIIMGARDDTLPDFARTIVDAIKDKKQEAAVSLA